MCIYATLICMLESNLICMANTCVLSRRWFQDLLIKQCFLPFMHVSTGHAVFGSTVLWGKFAFSLLKWQGCKFFFFFSLLSLLCQCSWVPFRVHIYGNALPFSPLLAPPHSLAFCLFHLFLHSFYYQPPRGPAPGFSCSFHEIYLHAIQNTVKRMTFFSPKTYYALWSKRNAE